MNIQCTTCKHSLYQTGTLQETTEGIYVICRYCATVYIMNTDVDYSGQKIVYLQPVKLSQKGFDESFTESLEKSEIEEFEELKEKIRNANTVNEFLKSLE
jgi:hypothetical protein